MEVGADDGLRDLDQVRVVREEQHLSGPCDLGKNPEARLSAPVVEIHEEVVREEWQADASRDRLLERGEPQCEEQLVGGALPMLKLTSAFK